MNEEYRYEGLAIALMCVVFRLIERQCLGLRSLRPRALWLRRGRVPLHQLSAAAAAVTSSSSVAFVL